MLAVFAAGCAVIALRAQVPAWLAWSLEFAVALLLVGIGARTIRNCFSGRYHFHFHRHGEVAPAAQERAAVTHAHLHFHSCDGAHDPAAHDAHLPRRARLRPLAVGMIHGLAGSAGLTLLVLTTIPSPWAGLTYLLVFGAGATAGMAALSTVLNLPLRRASTGVLWLRNARLAAGLANCAFGLFLAATALMPQNLPF